MKALAGSILSQRSEMEEFFIEALNEVSERRRRDVDFYCIGEILQNCSCFNVICFLKVKEAVRLERKLGKDKECEKRLSRSGPGIGLPAARNSAPNSKRSSTSSMHFPTLMKRERRESELQLSTSTNIRARGSKDPDVVLIKDLSWSDKELVLRALFAKFNESTAQKEKTEKGSRRGSDETEPLFFVSEGAIDFSPNGTYGYRGDSLSTTLSSV